MRKEQFRYSDNDIRSIWDKASQYIEKRINQETDFPRNQFVPIYQPRNGIISLKTAIDAPTSLSEYLTKEASEHSSHPRLNHQRLLFIPVIIDNHFAALFLYFNKANQIKGAGYIDAFINEDNMSDAIQVKWPKPIHPEHSAAAMYQQIRHIYPRFNLAIIEHRRYITNDRAKTAILLIDNAMAMLDYFYRGKKHPLRPQHCTDKDITGLYQQQQIFRRPQITFKLQPHQTAESFLTTILSSGNINLLDMLEINTEDTKDINFTELAKNPVLRKTILSTMDEALSKFYQKTPKNNFFGKLTLWFSQQNTRDAIIFLAKLRQWEVKKLGQSKEKQQHPISSEYANKFRVWYQQQSSTSSTQRQDSCDALIRKIMSDPEDQKTTTPFDL